MKEEKENRYKLKWPRPVQGIIFFSSFNFLYAILTTTSKLQEKDMFHSTM